MNQPTMTVYRPRRAARAERRVLLVLLSGASNLGGYTVARAAQVGPGRVHVILARLERRGWAEGAWEDPEPAGRPARRFYRLTVEGRSGAMEMLGLRA